MHGGNAGDFQKNYTVTAIGTVNTRPCLKVLCSNPMFTVYLKASLCNARLLLKHACTCVHTPTGRHARTSTIKKNRFRFTQIPENWTDDLILDQQGGDPR